jgi:tRNA pseudouridine38-40 synthase
MTAPRRVALLVAYDGSPFHGFQRQHGFPTIQSELEDAWAAVSAETITVMGSGRTDTGVHAMGQVVHFDTWSPLPELRIVKAINAYLPDEIVVRAAREVGPDFHANRSAIGKRYIYFLQVSETRPVWASQGATWLRCGRLDLAAMRAGARYLLGTHDFSSFAAAGRTTTTDIRTLRSIHILPLRHGLVICMQGDGFLYKMVRNIVGSLLDVGLAKWGPEWIRTVLQARDRKRAAATAPPDGLYLGRVLYPKPLFPIQRGRFSGEARLNLASGPVPQGADRLS